MFWSVNLQNLLGQGSRVGGLTQKRTTGPSPPETKYWALKGSSILTSRCWGGIVGPTLIGTSRSLQLLLIATLHYPIHTILPEFIQL